MKVEFKVNGIIYEDIYDIPPDEIWDTEWIGYTQYLTKQEIKEKYNIDLGE